MQVHFPSLMLVVKGPTCFGVRSFVGFFVIDLLLLSLLLRIFVALRTIGDPNHGVFLVRRELRNRQGEIVVVCVL